MTMLTETAVGAYPAHAMLLDGSSEERQWLIEHGLILVFFLRLSCEDEGMEDNVRAHGREASLHGFTSSETVPLKECGTVGRGLKSRKRTMRIFYTAMKSVLSPLNRCKQNGFVVKTG